MHVIHPRYKANLVLYVWGAPLRVYACLDSIVDAGDLYCSREKHLLRIFFCLKCRLSGPRYKANLLMHVWGTPLRAYVLIKLFIRRFVSWRHISVSHLLSGLHLLRASKRIPSKCVADVFSWNRRAGLSCLSLHLLVVECCPWSLHKVKFPITYLNVMH